MKIKFVNILLCSVIISCSPDKELVNNIPNNSDQLSSDYEYFDEDLFPYFGNSTLLLDSMDSKQAALGRFLFYDSRLSRNNTISCASCHRQHQSFSDGKRNSPGFIGELSSRNTIALANVGFQPSIFWDASGNGLENDVLRPIINPLEMGFDTIDELITKLMGIEEYLDFFENVYGDKEINEKRVGSALAQFIAALISYQSDFDKGLQNDFMDYSNIEKLGKDLYFGEALCSRCHNAPFFAGDRNVPVNIGLDLEYKDQGNGNGKFKVPTLRNISLTAPYMHDGRFQSLSEVIQHYSSGIQNHNHLSSQLKDQQNGNNPVQLNLDQEEKDALIAFLETLTDWEFVNDERFATPY